MPVCYEDIESTERLDGRVERGPPMGRIVGVARDTDCVQFSA